MSKNIVLIGFMGSGKSSIASMIAAQTGRKLIECDQQILKRTGFNDMNELFAQKGEIFLRESEIELSKSLAKENNLVISTGGGCVMNKLNIDYLKENGIIIYLQTEFSTLKLRLAGDTTRPLFADTKKAESLYNLRANLYSNYADLIVVTDKATPGDLCKQILQKIDD